MRHLRSFLIVLLLIIISLLIARKWVRLQNYSLSIPGKIFAVNKRDSSITAFDLRSGKHIDELFLEYQPREIVALPNGKDLVLCNYGNDYFAGTSLSIISSGTISINKNIELPKGRYPYGIKNLDPGKSVIVATNGSNKLFIVNIANDSIEKVIPTKQKMSHMMALHPHKPWVYVTNKRSGSVTVINHETGVIINTINCSNRSDGIDITPDGKEVWVTNPLENTISIIDTNTNSIIETLQNGRESLRAKFTLDGKQCFVTNARDGTIIIFDRFTKEKIKTIVIPGIANLWQRFLYKTPRPVGILMHPNGEYAFITNSNADKVEIIDMKSLTLIGNISTGRVPDGLTIVDY